MLHRYRVAMVRAEREPLQVTSRSTRCRRRHRPRRKTRSGTRKCIVVIAVEVKQPRGFGGYGCVTSPTARAKASYRSSATWWRPTQSCSPTAGGATADCPATATHAGSPSCRPPGFQRRRHARGAPGRLTAQALDPRHPSRLDRSRPLQSYLEEFTFRFNRRSSGNRGLVFRRLLEQAVVTVPVTEAKVTHGYEW